MAAQRNTKRHSLYCEVRAIESGENQTQLVAPPPPLAHPPYEATPGQVCLYAE